LPLNCLFISRGANNLTLVSARQKGHDFGARYHDEFCMFSQH
jgi:hypothetical protein